MSDLKTELTKTNIMCEFKILGNDFVPEVVSKKLQIVPSKTTVKGEQINKSGKKRDFSSWIYCTEYCETYDINDQLTKIITLLRPKEKHLLELKESYNLDYMIEVVINIESQVTPAIYLEKEVISFCNSLDIMIDFDLYIMS